MNVNTLILMLFRSLKINLDGQTAQGQSSGHWEDQVQRLIFPLLVLNL